MAFDGITTKHIIKELNCLIGGKIRKIHQPETDEINLLINVGRDNYNLLISANGNNPRIHLTKKKKENPGTPPAFCMVLRKHLLNGTIETITQHLTDRIVKINIGTKNEFGEPVTKTLLIEIMARNSNIILLDHRTEDENGTIIDAVKKVGSSVNRFRQILPGRAYLYPPEEGRRSFSGMDKTTFLTWLEENKTMDSERFFVQKFLGISPAAAREICFRAGLPDKVILNTLGVKQSGFLFDAFAELIAEIEVDPTPRIYYFRHEIIEFATIDLKHLDSTDCVSYDSVSVMLESYYYLKDKKQRFVTKSANLRQHLNGLLKKSYKKLQNLREDRRRSEKGDHYKKIGDLITANIYQLTKGMKSAELIDYTDPEMKPVAVQLKVNESPSQNAQRYYKRYNKSKRALVELARQIETTEEQVYYLESLLNGLEHSTELNELDEIRDEYTHSEFYKKAPGRGAKKQKIMPSKPMQFVSSEGFKIYVGKNNYQNDTIVTRIGTAEDCWLHVKDIPGSHVLVVADGRFIEEATLIEAGMLAAWYSKYRHSENVPVDYIEFKYLHKPKNAKPGMVTFTNQNTMIVTPDEEVIASLAQIE